MGFPLHLLMTATPPPGGDLREGLDPDQVSPGLVGFIATLAVVLVTVLLILDMTRRVRRVRYRKEAEDLAGAGNDGGATALGPEDPRGPDRPRGQGDPRGPNDDGGGEEPNGSDHRSQGFRGQNPPRG